MSEFIIGLFLIVVGLRGNAGNLIVSMGEDGSFVPFTAALAIFYWLWENVPPPEDKATKALIVGLGGAVLISQYSRVISGLSTSWSAIEALGHGTFSATDFKSGGSAGSLSPQSQSGGFGNLSAGQIEEESGGNQFTSTGAPLVSSAGAVGIAQVLPSTAEQVANTFGIPYSESELENSPLYNEEIGSDYMEELSQQFGGNNTAALAAYNWGPGNVTNAMNQYGSNWFNYIPSSVQNYVQNAQ
jgi:hypothetical protein